MSRGQVGIVLVAGGYLAVILCGALKIKLVPQAPQAGQVARSLLYCSGADNSYGFFAPSVSDEVELEFELSATERTWTEKLSDLFANEARQRTGTMVDIFAHVGEPEVQRSILESWAEWALARHPEAHAVRVTLKHRVMPTMAEYRDGVRPEWKNWAWANFER
jgi:hypothetical protein